MRWIIQSRPRVANSANLPCTLAPWSTHRELAVLPFLHLVGAAVPHEHVAGPVAAIRYVALEVEVFERVVLRVDGKSIDLRCPRDASRQRPRPEHAVVFETQVPMQTGGVVLLDHEPLRSGTAGRGTPFGSGVAVKSRMAR